MVDYWTFGCLIYEMLMGHPPFTTTKRDHKVLYEAIKSGKYTINSRLDEDAKDLIKKLLVTNVASCHRSPRLGWATTARRRSRTTPSSKTSSSRSSRSST
jgi:serine/threonine protein kinase